MSGSKFLYLIQECPRALLADALLEYRAYAAEHPGQPMAETLLEVSSEVRLALREKRRIMSATGEPGKPNAHIGLSEAQRRTVRSARRKRLRDQAAAA